MNLLLVVLKNFLKVCIAGRKKNCFTSKGLGTLYPLSKNYKSVVSRTPKTFIKKGFVSEYQGRRLHVTQDGCNSWHAGVEKKTGIQGMEICCDTLVRRWLFRNKIRNFKTSYLKVSWIRNLWKVLQCFYIIKPSENIASHKRPDLFNTTALHQELSFKPVQPFLRLLHLSSFSLPKPISWLCP